MSSCSQYLEIDSSYRERKLYSKPSNFKVLFENIDGSGKLKAREPVSDAYPIYGWHGIQLSVSGLGTSASHTQVFFPLDQNFTPNPGSGKERFSGGSPHKPILNTGAYIQAGNMFNGSWTGHTGGLNTSNTTGNGVKDYYAGAVLIKMNGGDVDEIARILSYNPDTNTCTLENGFAELDVATDNYVLGYDFNPINSTNPTLHIAGGKNVDNYYVGNIVEDITLMQENGLNISATATITKYDAITRVATLDAPFDKTLWKSSDNYIIRKANPIFRGIVSASGAGGGIQSASGTTTINNAVVSATIKTAGSGYTVGNVYHNSANPSGNFTIRVDSVDSSGGIGSFSILNPGFALASSPTSGLSVGDNITISGGGGNAVLNITATGFGISISGTSANCTKGTTSTLLGGNNNFKGDFLYVPSRYQINGSSASNTQFNLYPGTFPNQYPAIVSAAPVASTKTIGEDITDYGSNWPNYNGSNSLSNINASSASMVNWKSTLPTRVGGVTGTQQILANYKDDANNQYIIVPDAYINASSANPAASFDTSASGAFRDHTYFEILPYSRDGYSPLLYRGSRVSQQEEICYEMELMQLILPNQTLKNSPGGLLSFFSHIYVELSPFNGGNTTTFTSNNPNSRKALFKVPILDIPQKIVSKFVRLDGENMINTVKFRPNEGFDFRIYLPNGEDLEYEESDYQPPSPYNSDVQICALFRYKRVCN